MPAPYSYDLRCKAIEAVEQGERKSAVCRMLNISRNTLDLWLKREEETGDCRAISGFQRGNRHKRGSRSSGAKSNAKASSFLDEMV